ncbi:MAG: hydrogenase/urease maturation nickel metallochaperone HypA [Anaerolineales bacterium]
MLHPRLETIVQQLGHKEIQSVRIALGELFPLTEEQLRKQWSETRFRDIPFTVRMIQAEQQCMVCFQKYHPLEKETSCPHCGSVGAKILTGEEFYMESFEVKDE